MLQRIEIGIDTTDPLRLAGFWSEALGYEIGDLDRAGVYLDLRPPPGPLPHLYLQRVAEEKATIKNRLHLDLWVDDPPETIARLTALGATVMGEHRTGSEGGWWQVMMDPEGNEFCVCRAA